MFIGEYRGKIDDKGRIVIPARLRKIFFDSQVYSVFLTRGLENCIFLFPEKDWNVQTDKLKSLPFTRVDPRSFTRLFFSGAFQARIDRQGRIGLPQNLIVHAKLKEDFVVIGVGDRLEIWAEDLWNGYYSEAMNSYGKVAETLLGST